MKLTYENRGIFTFLTCALDRDEVLDTTSVGMITNNRIPGLLDTVFTQTDSNRYIKYNVSARVTVRQIFMGMVNRKRVLGVLNGIVNAFLSADEYMIDPKMILLDEKYMFSDVSTCETRLVCVPVDSSERSIPDIPGFIRNLIFSAQFDQSENSNYVAKIISYLNGSSSAFSLERFKGLLKEIGSADTGLGQPGIPLYPQSHDVRTNLTYVPPVEVPQAENRREKARPDSVKPTQDPPRPVISEVTHQNEAKIERDMGFFVPPSGDRKSDIPRVGADEMDVGGAQKEQISLFYLLQHYSKENAQAYKAQKERKKGLKEAGAQKKDKKKEKKSKKKDSQTPQFQIPGKDENWTDCSAPAYQVQPSVVGVPGQAGRGSSVNAGTYGSRQEIGNDDYGNFGDTIYIDQDSDENQDTVIMGLEGAGRQIMPFLIRKRNNERIPLKKAYFRIGRDYEYNDYSIADNKFVGHSHCHIVTRDDEYFIVDDNSKNHTFVNGSVIPSGQEVKLAHGYSINVADEQFEFRLY